MQSRSATEEAHRRGDRLFAEATGSSFGPDGLELGLWWALGLNWFLGSSFRVSGLTRSIWRSFGFSCIQSSCFLIIGLASRAQIESVYSLPPDFSKTEFLKINFWKNNMHKCRINKKMYLTFKLCLGRQSREFKLKKLNFKLTTTSETWSCSLGFLGPISHSLILFHDSQIFLAWEVTQ